MTRLMTVGVVVMLSCSPCGLRGDDPKPAPPKVNPLQNLLQRIIPPRKTPAPNEKEVDPDAADEIDERVAKDRRQQDALKKASAAIEQQDWQTVLDLLPRLLGEKDDSVTRLGPSVWGSVRKLALKLLLALPDEARQRFQERWNGEARRQLEAAQQAQRWPSLVPIATQYLLTESGQEAADRLANWHFDRGEFTLATRWFQRVEESRADRARTRVWQLKAAFAAARAGEAQLAERWQRGGNDSSEELVEIAGESVRVDAWWRERPQSPPQRKPLAEWPMTFGNPSRSAIASGGAPLMWSRWQRPLTDVQSLQQQIESLSDDCRDQQLATVPVTQPVFVDGLIALRTLNGVQVWNAATGELLWSTGDDRAGELASPAASPGGVGVQIQININININVNINRGRFAVVTGEAPRGAERSDLDNSPLANLLFGNGQFGPLSTDGQQLWFVVDESTGANAGDITNLNGIQFRRGMPARRGADSNRLVSFGLRSGRMNWTIGGIESDEAFQAPLAGVYFFGPPVPDGDDLFLIGERENEVRVYCLDRETGRPQWSQLLAIASESIARDAGRRQMVAQAALADGVIVCPTTVGWLTAIDRRSRNVLWTQRYSHPLPAANRRRFPGQNVTTLPPWSDRWRPTVPVIAGDAVVFTPPETEDQQRRQGSIVCFGLHDGARRWVLPREQNWMTLNSVQDGRVLMLGARRAAALSLKNGEKIWEQMVAGNDGAPSGLGMVVNDRWFVPIGTEQLWTLSLKDGSVVSKQAAPPDVRLGNLFPYRGTVVSVHPAGVACLEQRDVLLAEIARRRTESASDPIASLMEAAVQRLEQKPAKAWELLANVPVNELPAEARSRYRRQAREVLFELAEARPRTNVDALPRLRDLLDSPDDRAQWERLKFEELRDRGEWLPAFQWWRDMSRSSPGSDVPLSGIPVRSVRRDVWLAGALANLWHAMPADARKQIEPTLLADIRSAVAANPENDLARRRTLQQMSVHPAARQALWQLADEQLTRGDFARGELGLLALVPAQMATASPDKSRSTGSTESPGSAGQNDARDSSLRNESARAWHRLVELYRDRKLSLDANVAARQLNDLGSAELSDGVSAATWVDQELTAGRLGKGTHTEIPDWSQFTFRLERLPRETFFGNSSQDCTPPDAAWPFFDDMRFRFEQTNYPIATQRLMVTRTNDRRLEWSQPLRSQPGALSSFVVSRAVGHQLLILYRDVLHLLSPLDQRVVWTQTLPSRGLRSLHGNVAQRHLPPPLQPFSQAESIVLPQEFERRRGSLVHSSPRFVVCRSRKTLNVLDTTTGERLWELQDLPGDAMIVATDDLLAITSQRWPQPAFLRTADGTAIPADDALRQAHSQINRVLDNDWLLIRPGTAANSKVVERWNPARRQSVWSQSVAANDQFTWVDQRTLLLSKTDNTLHELNSDSGQSRKLGNLPMGSFAQQQRQVLADRDRVYLIFTAQPPQTMNSELPNLPVNGTIIAWNRHAEEEVWRQQVTNHLLVLDQWTNSPVLLFSHTAWEARNNVAIQHRHLMLLDKRTGKTLYDEKFPHNIGGERGVHINLTTPQIDFQGIDRIRLVAVPPK